MRKFNYKSRDIETPFIIKRIVDQTKKTITLPTSTGIEGIIGQLKRRYHMGRSRMKSDRTIESSGYCSMLGFNLAQLSRFLAGEAVKKAA